jgi:serine/threonine protein kinase
VTTPDSDDDDEFEGLDELDDEEWARRIGQIAARRGRPGNRLPPDLYELFSAIAEKELLRKVGSPGLPRPGHMLDEFEAFHCVIGGMGMIVEAIDRTLERKVALKFWLQSGEKAQEKLLSEAKALARLSHRNVVTVHGTGQWRERVYFVMEWIDGVDAKTWMAQPRTWREVRYVFIEAGRGLAEAHDKGIHHRDFKPENVLISVDGRVVVADFGIAESLREVENTDPRWGTPAGTPVYMAPERLRGERGDARSDQFSFCVAMWRGLFGLRPFAGEKPEELLEAIELGDVRAPPAGVPRWLSDVLRKGLANDPTERYRSMHDLLATLLDEPAGGELDVDESFTDEDPDEPDDRVLHTPAAAQDQGEAPELREPRAAIGDDEEIVIGGSDTAIAPAPPQRERWSYFVIGVLSVLVAVLGLIIIVMPPPLTSPEPSVAINTPYDEILRRVADDDFLGAWEYWDDHKTELTDAESLKIARMCLARSKDLKSKDLASDQAKANDAAFAVRMIANHVQLEGQTDELKKQGGQLEAEAVSLARDRPPE